MNRRPKRTIPRIARRGSDSSQRLGRHRWVVEQSQAWLVGYRRLQVRYERRGDLLLGFLQLACALICLKRLDRPSAAPRRGRRRAGGVPISRRP